MSWDEPSKEGSEAQLVNSVGDEFLDSECFHYGARTERLGGEDQIV